MLVLFLIHKYVFMTRYPIILKNSKKSIDKVMIGNIFS